MKHFDVLQNTPEWRGLHLGKPTTSDFSKLITPKGNPSQSMEAYAQKLAGDLYCGIDLDAWKGNQYTDRGHEVEPEAVAWYEFNFADTQPVGFITDDKEQYGSSPDRLVGKHGLLEVKCLPKYHLIYLLNYIRKRETPSEFIPQTQGQLFVNTDRKWCDLLFYHEILPKFVIRQRPDLNMFAAIAGQLKECLALRDEIIKEIIEFDKL